ncbi:hypothetical protein GMDG_03948 [Pseudogymnoascus destructans 20631-21]|uniref:Uncharacterized protein n=1 Tax=Pseudogymnoascus destructans (strain ATCC MYA-4855 / 20631-21) TaxID=658429 RepID=L8G929_PSED2|nr:hypothetical protein GMDG_03948 [Pseudogymnoascus destructans 20631-21]
MPSPESLQTTLPRSALTLMTRRRLLISGLIPTPTVATVKSSYESTAKQLASTPPSSHGIVNTFVVKVLRYLNNTSILLHSGGVAAIAIAVLAKAPTHQPASALFQKFYDGTAATPGEPGWSIRASPAYVAY